MESSLPSLTQTLAVCVAAAAQQIYTFFLHNHHRRRVVCFDESVENVS